MSLSRPRPGKAATGGLLALSAGVAALLAAAPARAQLALTPAGAADGFTLSTFATGFPTNGSVGPLGFAFNGDGSVLVSDDPGNVRLFPTDTDGQDAGALPVAQNYGANNAIGITQSGGKIYMTQQGNNDLVQINPDGTFNQVVVTGLPGATGLVADPATGHLFVSTIGNGSIYDVDPAARTATLFQSGQQFDGLSLSADDKTLYAADTSAGTIRGYDTTTKALVFDSGAIPGGVDGTALGTGTLLGDLFINTNGGTVYEESLTTLAQTQIADSGSRGDFVTVDPANGSLLLTQTDRVVRLTAPHGGGFGPPPAVPEPAPLALLALGLVPVGLTLHARRKRPQA